MEPLTPYSLLLNLKSAKEHVRQEGAEKILTRPIKKEIRVDDFVVGHFAVLKPDTSRGILFSSPLPSEGFEQPYFVFGLTEKMVCLLLIPKLVKIAVETYDGENYLTPEPEEVRYSNYYQVVESKLLKPITLEFFAAGIAHVSTYALRQYAIARSLMQEDGSIPAGIYSDYWEYDRAKRLAISG